jgi:lysyl-tRNA synthetase class II
METSFFLQTSGIKSDFIEEKKARPPFIIIYDLRVDPLTRPRIGNVEVAEKWANQCE